MGDAELSSTKRAGEAPDKIFCDWGGEFCENLGRSSSEGRASALRGMDSTGPASDDERIKMMRAWPHSGLRVHTERLTVLGNNTELLECMERPLLRNRTKVNQHGWTLHTIPYHTT